MAGDLRAFPGPLSGSFGTMGCRDRHNSTAHMAAPDVANLRRGKREPRRSADVEAQRRRALAILRMAAQRPGQSFSWYGGGDPTPEKVVWSGRPTRFAAVAQLNAKTAIAFRPLRTRHVNRQPRARAAKRSPRGVAARNRDGPHLGDDDPPPLAPNFHPRQGATAVARALTIALRGAT